MDSVLVIDIGNTSTSIGLYRSGRLSRVSRMATSGSDFDTIRRKLKAYRTKRAVIASVAPQVNRTWERAVNRPVLWVTNKLKLGVTIDYPKPKTIGADRLANSAGGFEKYGKPLIVADFGTAVTFDCVSKDASYIGGVIAPGLPLMFSYLNEKTAKLPLITVGPTRSRVGRSTREAMRLGARWGYRGMVREILMELLKRPELKGAALVATGGYADWVVDGLEPRMIVDHGLTLYGLGKIFELNT